jgi:CheY-like chemotaxis protein
MAELLNQALAAASRAGSLVKHLLTFSRGGAPSRRLVDNLGSLIRDVASFASRGTSVRCAVDIAEPLGVVEVDVGQIGQVIQNLVLNACQASSGGATVHVRARREPGAAGGRVVIEVADSGSGIAPEHLSRIFEPFFSARAGGTGLGLAVSRSIIQRHGGRLGVSSELGKGTVFTVELPGSDRTMPAERPAAAAVTRFSGRALVMDDDDAVRRTAKVLLASIGFEVDDVAHGGAALERAARAAAEQRPFRVAVLDLTIVGGLGAPEIAQDLRRVSPGIALVLSSGYARSGPSHAWDALLHKPYTLEELSAAIDRALRAVRAG